MFVEDGRIGISVLEVGGALDSTLQYLLQANVQFLRNFENKKLSSGPPIIAKPYKWMLQLFEIYISILKS